MPEHRGRRCYPLSSSFIASAFGALLARLDQKSEAGVGTYHFAHPALPDRATALPASPRWAMKRWGLFAVQAIVFLGEIQGRRLDVHGILGWRDGLRPRVPALIYCALLAPIFPQPPRRMVKAEPLQPWPGAESRWVRLGQRRVNEGQAPPSKRTAMPAAAICRLASSIVNVP